MARCCFVWPVLALTSLIPLGCSHGTPATAPSLAPAAIPPGSAGAPGTAGAPPAFALGDIATSGDLQESALALWTLHLDPATLSATLEPQASRSLQQTDDLYDLSIDNLLEPDSFQIIGIEADGDDFIVRYRFAHPFPAPTDVAAPATAANRADLGIAGRVMFLTDTRGTGTFDFFTGDGDVKLFPGLITNTDGYLQPRGLLTLTGFNANAFPYIALVHEDPDASNREVPAAPSDPRGNFDAATGWQRDDFGPTNNGFAGYGILHQGQSVVQEIRFDRATLDTYGATNIGVAVIGKYTDPRGGATLAEKKANRLPASPASTAKFVYREPHGSLDCESIQLLGINGGITVNDGAASITPLFWITDWDARATETGEANLADDGNASHIRLGTAGPPALEFCIPDILGDASTVVPWNNSTALRNDDTAVGGDSGQDSGRPGDALFYSDTLTNVVTTGQTRRTYWGVVRATDPEDALAPDDRTTLDANLQPVTVNRPRIETYQAFPVTMANTPPSLTVAMVDATVDSAVRPALQVTGYSDPDGDAIAVEIDWDDNGTFEDTQGINPGDPNPVWTSPDPFNATVAANSSHTIHIHFTDEVMFGIIDLTPAPTFTLGPNKPPAVSGSLAISNSAPIAPASLFVNQGTAVATDPEGDPITYRVTNTGNSEVLTGTTFPLAVSQALFSEVGPVTVTVRATDPLHTGTNGTAFAPLTATIHAGGWAKRVLSDSFNAVAIDVTADRVAIVGNFFKTINFEGGSSYGFPGNVMFIVMLDRRGNYLWHRAFGDSNGGSFVDVRFLPSGEPVAFGAFNGTQDFDAIPLNAGTGNAVLVKLDPDTGAVTNARLLPLSTTGRVSSQALTIDAAGAMYCGGNFTATTDFGGGGRLAVGDDDAFLVKFDAGDTYAWDRTWGSADFDRITCIDISSTGPIYAGVNFEGPIDFGFGTRTPLFEEVSAILKISASTQTVLWDRAFDRAGIQDVAVSPDGSAVVAGGEFFGNTNFGGGTRTTPFDTGWIARYSSGNTYLWDRVFLGDGPTSCSGIVLNANDQLTVATRLDGATDLGGGTVTPEGGSAGCLVQYSSDGGFRWQNVYQDPFFGGYMSLDSIGIDPAGDLVAAGQFGSLVDFDPGPGVYTLTGIPKQITGCITSLSGATGLWE